MSEESWEQQEGESGRWYARFVLFRDMGPTRTLLGCVHLEEEKVGKSRKKSVSDASGAWRDAARTWKWRERAEQWDTEQLRLALAACKYARVDERVSLLEKWVNNQDSAMIAHMDDKGYARADSIEQLRGLLDDIAKETGGRIKVTKNDTTTTHDMSGAAARLLQKLEALPDDDNNAQTA